MHELRDRWLGSDTKCWHCHKDSPVLVARFAKLGTITVISEVVLGLGRRPRLVKEQESLFSYGFFCSDCWQKILDKTAELKAYRLGTIEEVKNLSPIIQPCRLCRGTHSDCPACSGAGWVPWHGLNPDDIREAIAAKKQEQVQKAGGRQKATEDQPIKQPRRGRFTAPSVRREKQG